MRGQHRSVPIEDLVLQAKHLARYGVKELILIAQELTYYGLDLYKKRALNELLHKLAAIDGIEWIRLHYAYPSKFPLEILDVIRDEPKICNYIDLPLQHISDPILTAMKRQISKEETIQLVQTIRDKIPGIHFRTTFLVGFPGETDAIFQELCEFVRFAKFERMGVFQYSQEEDTSAYQLGDLVSPETKEARAAELMAIQEDISYELNQKKLNKVYKVLIDKKENNYYFGRTEFDSPEVDNDVLFENPSTNYLRIGDFVNARIIKADAYDLIAVPEF